MSIAVVKVGPYYYQVEPLAPAQTEALEGMTDFKRTTIYVDVSLPSERQEVVLWHELLHALCDLTGLGLGHDVEERVVDALAPALFQVLEENDHISKIFWTPKDTEL